jgi:phosphosulfolactate synthase (CoM biosynthesis protein A)
VLEVAGQWVDGIKYARGSFALMPKAAVEAMVLSHGLDAVDAYLSEAKALGFDVIELSSGFISLPVEAAPVKLPHGFDELAKRARQAVELPDNERVALTHHVEHTGSSAEP